MDKKHILILDTTLRDGEQAPGFSMNMAEKLEIAEVLEELGVDVIEAGFPISSEDDMAAVKEIAKRASTGVAALARARREDILRAAEALRDAKKPRLHVFIATSGIHMEHKLHMTESEVLEAIEESVALASSLCPEVEFSCEDATRSDLAFLKKAVRTAVKAGASVVNLPDTVGYATPTETYGIYRNVMEDADPAGKILFSTHCHNDLGMAVANSVAAVAAGARQVECTLCGIGERAGNASLEEVVMALRTRNDFYKAETGIRTKLLYPACRKLSSVVGIATPPNKPIIGVNAFAHEAGIHQHGILSNRATYEIISPEDVGIPKNDMILGKHSGRHAFEQRLSELGIRMDREELDEAFEMFKQVAERKKAVTDKDLHAIAGEKRRSIGKGFRLVRFIVNSGNTIPSMASVKLERDGNETEDSCMGSGPIDAAFKTVDRIVRHTKGYESLRYTLEDYSINSVTEGEDALGEVLIKLRSDGVVYTGRGLSTDILEASLKAYINGVNKLLTI
ncbi:MAG: 2-isopropylmalate synthase [Clostridia bacterium]|nr:2-isopropylmalate synthase [Clostridia bacterium]